MHFQNILLGYCVNLEVSTLSPAISSCHGPPLSVALGGRRTPCPQSTFLHCAAFQGCLGILLKLLAHCTTNTQVTAERVRCHCHCGDTSD